MRCILSLSVFVVACCIVFDIRAADLSSALNHIHNDSGKDMALPDSADWTAEDSSVIDPYFAYSVSTAGDVNGDGYADVIIGAPYFDGVAGVECGKAYVFHGSASGLAAAPAWTVTGKSAGEQLGASVSWAGDVNGDGYSDVIIGAYVNDSSRGKAYVFHGSASGVTGDASSPAWSRDGDAVGDEFGRFVSSAGDVNGDGYSDIIIGAPKNTSSTGKAYVFHGSASGISGGLADWSAVGEAADNYFSRSVSSAGDVNGDGYSDIIIGAYGNDVPRYTGKAYVFHGSASGITGDAFSPAWSVEGEGTGNRLGYSVSSAGDVNGDGYSDVIIGAYGRSSNTGRIYAFHGSAAGISGDAATAPWKVDGEAASDYFGWSVSTAGDVNGDGYSDVIVGAFGNGGNAYVFRGSSSGVLGEPGDCYWRREGPDAGNFGYSASSAGDVNGDGCADVIVGAYHVGVYDGRAYAYYGSNDGLVGGIPDSAWDAVGLAADDEFGRSVRIAGDVNGDGYTDVIVGAPGYDGDRGAVYVYHGSASGIASAEAWSAVGESTSSGFGCSVSTAGDVNGDGYSDIVIGSMQYSVSKGKAYVFHGSASGITGDASIPAWSASGEIGGSYFGGSVSTAGDVNGDGYSDIVIGAYRYSSYTGKVYVFHGSSSGISGDASTPAWSEPGAASSNYGISVTTAGDVNGDGYDDLAIGATGYNTQTGKTFVYYGSDLGIAGPGDSISGESAWGDFGFSVSTAGDVNGDGYDDLAVSAKGIMRKAYLFNGGAAGINPATAWTTTGDGGIGSSVSSGDVNGDGYSDIIVGADSFSGTTGRVYVYHGSSSGVEAACAWSVTGESDGDILGWSVSGAGDVNGDGYADMIIGAYGNAANTGKAYIFQGGGGDGRDLKFKIQRSNNTIIQGWSGRGDADRMKLASTVFSTQGRNNVKLRAQVLASGKSWTADSGDIIESISAWTDSGVPGADLAQSLPGLTEKTYYQTRIRIFREGIKEPPSFSPWFYGVAKTCGGETATPARGFNASSE